jgi:hypothetical protein
MGARSGQRNARLYSLGRVQEELAESERGKESGKVWGQNEWKGRVPDTNGILERKVKEHGEDGERGKYYQKNGYASEDVERLRAKEDG